jgi:hypothetical protein
LIAAYSSLEFFYLQFLKKRGYMNMHTDPKRPYYKIGGILLIALLADQYCSAKIVPWESSLLGITPIIVFLDIPVPLPFTIGLFPVLLFFSLFYWLFSKHYQQPDDPTGRKKEKMKLGKILGALVTIPGCMFVGGLFYLLIHDFLPKRVQNGIESVGINGNLYLPIPGFETIHFKGSMIILASCWIGWRIFRKKISAVLEQAPVHPEKIQEMAVSVEKSRMAAMPQKQEREKAGMQLVK